MSYLLRPQRRRVAFNVRTGAQTNFDLSPYMCILNIKTNMYFYMTFASLQDARFGNFSSWVPIDPGEAIAVTGLASCGGVFFANSDFSMVAAGHMSGDAQFVAQWCDSLAEDGVRPHYLLWATGPDGSRSLGGRALRQYMRRFGINPVRAPAVANCTQIVLSQDGLVHAAYGDDIIAEAQ